jgi:hypothetical protein
MLESLKEIVEKNPLIFLTLSSVGLIASILEIVGFLGERRKRRIEKVEREKQERLLSTYEYIFSRADKSIRNERELKELEDEIGERTNLIPELEQRIHSLKLAAKREVIAQAMDRLTSDLLHTHEELAKLRVEHSALGDLPKIPDAKRADIENEVRQASVRPYEFPKSLTFRCLLLVLLLMLLPWPAEAFLVAALLHVFLRAFFEATSYSSDPEIYSWVTKHAYKLGALSAIGTWFLVFSGVGTLTGHISSAIENTIYSELFRGRFPRDASVLYIVVRENFILLVNLIWVLLTALIGMIHWRIIAPRVLGTNGNGST